MSRSMVTLGIVLGTSLMVNAVLLGRILRPEPADPGSVRPGPAPATLVNGDMPVFSPVAGEKRDRIVDELAQLRREVEAIQARPGSTRSEGSRETETVQPSPVGRDPVLVEILAEQDRLTQFWGDLRKLLEARDHLDDATYSQALINATADFLGLDGAARNRFSETTKAFWPEAEAARREFNEAQRRIYDPKNPKAYQAAWEAINVRYQEQMGLVKDRLKTALDLDQQRQKNFCKTLDSWVQYIAEKSPIAAYGPVQTVMPSGQ